MTLGIKTAFDPSSSRQATGAGVSRLELQLQEAVERGVSYLLSLQAEEGYWLGELEADSTLESDYIFYLHVLGKADPGRIAKLANYIRRKQLPDGGWNIYPGGPAEINATVKAYFALKLASDSVDAPHLAGARGKIHELGGLEATNSFTRFYLALVGAVEWEMVPAIPPELMLLPNWFYLNIYEMSSWTRGIVIPMAILSAVRPDWRHAGRDFLIVLYTAFRSLKLYPIENTQVQKALDDLAATTKHLLDVEKELEIRLQGEFIFVNSTRLRLDLDNYASFSHILNVLQQCGIGAVRLDEGVDRRQLQVFVSLLLVYAAKEANPNKLFELSQKLTDGGVSHVSVEPPLEAEEDVEEEERQKEAAKRTYARSVAATKEVINSIRMGRTANVKKVKRAVQAIVDQVLNNESSLVGLTTLRDYDEYTFTHSVNVCIFSVALGRKLGLTKLQLYDLGMASLFHDVGKSRVPL